MNGMTLLPQKFARTQKRAGGLLPPHDAHPLVIQFRQVAVGLHDVGVVLAEERLAGGTHAQALLQFFVAAVGHPRHFRRKALDVIFLFIEQAFGDEHRHADVLVSRRLEHPVQNMLHQFPNGIAVRTDHHTPFHAGVFDEFRFFDDVGIPLGKILVHGGDGLHHFFVVRHVVYPPFRPGDPAEPL